MKIFTIILALMSFSFALVGCQGDGADPNYSTEIKMTDEEKAKEAQIMKNQKMPGGITPGQPVEPGNAPGALTVPGKGK